MTSQIEQKISELVDGELHSTEREQLYKQLKGAEHHQKTWSRYCLISDALKNNLPPNPKHDLSARIKTALETEPVYLVPTSHANTETESSKTFNVDIPAAAFAGRERPAFRFGFGMAAAASIAVVSVVSVLVVNQSTSPEQQMVMTAERGAHPAPVMSSGFVSSAPVQLVASPLVNSTVVSANRPGNTMVPSGHWDRLPSQDAAGLEKFLIEHSELSSQTAVTPGMFPYARVVGFESNGTK